MTRHCGKCSYRWPRAAHFCPKCGAPETSAVEHIPAKRLNAAGEKKTDAPAETAGMPEVSTSLAFRLGSTVGNLIKKDDPAAQMLGGLAGELLAVFLAPKKEIEPEPEKKSQKILEQIRERRAIRKQRDHEIELAKIKASRPAPRRLRSKDDGS